MSAYQSHFDNQPLRYYRGHPIYLSTILTGVLAAGIVIVLLLEAAHVSPMALEFIPSAFFHGMLWQPITYVFVNPISFFTPLSLLCFYSWGGEIERYLGRRRFLAICGALILAPVAVGSAFYLLAGGIYGVGSSFYLVSGLLAAFATLYPNMDYFGWVPLKWFAFVCIACGSLMSFPEHDWIGLFTLWVNCAVAFGMIQGERGFLNIRMPKFRWPSSKPKFRVVPKPAPRSATVSSSAPRPEGEEDVDALLDKIARSGMDSLTASEKARLEKARQDLLRRGS